MTSAFLKACGNSPNESDLLIISMIMGVKIVLQDFTSPVGKGSSAREFSGPCSASSSSGEDSFRRKNSSHFNGI